MLALALDARLDKTTLGLAQWTVRRLTALCWSSLQNVRLYFPFEVGWTH